MTRKHWHWKDAGAWRRVGTARRSGTVLPGGVWAEPGENAVVLCFLGVLFSNNDALLGLGDIVP